MTSLGKVEENGDTMWKCEKDILKDLAYLNDFGDAEPHTILYSNGRGKIRQKQKTREKFLDPRTGEEIDVNDSEISYTDSFHTGRGRGRHIGGFSNKQLQEQLRLARPLGSGDEAIESFCRRFQVEIPRAVDGASTSDSDGDSQTGRIRSKPSGRIIGSRNSVLQSNALINGLLSKTKDNSKTVTRGETNCGGDTEQDDDDTSKSDVISTGSGTSCSILSDKDFPPLYTRSKKEF